LAKTQVEIGPAHHGQRMTLAAFRDAEGAPGYGYELARGVVHVIQVPGGDHAAVLGVIRRKLDRYWDERPERIALVAAAGDCRVEAPSMASERHPECAVYLSPRPDAEPPWAEWVPEIVVEVVSRGGEERDYHEKRVDYLAVGVQEYWIVDPGRRAMLLLTRRGDTWHEESLGSDGVCRTRRLPGLELPLSAVFAPLA